MASLDILNYFFIFFGVIALSFFGIESYLRKTLKTKAVYNDHITGLLFYSEPIQSNPHRQISFRHYVSNANLIASADFKLNNLGLFSENNYNIGSKDEKEFRIVVIGGEQTASTVSDVSWPDFLEKDLNNKLQQYGYHYKVFNIGWPDAGPVHYCQYWETFGKNFSADLVLVNFVETDFYRGLRGSPLYFRGVSISKSCPIEYSVGNSKEDIVKTSVSVVGEAPVTSFRDPRSIPARPYGFFAAKSFMDDKNKVCKLQKMLAADFIEGGMPFFGYLTLSKLLGKKFKMAEKRNFDSWLSSDQADESEMVAFVQENFRKIFEAHPHVLFIHSRNFPEIVGNVEFKFTKKLGELNPDLSIIDIKDYLPVAPAENELKSWYNPNMQEKWTLKGHHVYAQAVMKLITERCELFNTVSINERVVGI